MLAGQIIGKGSLFLSLMLLSRYLSDADFGGLLFAVALGQIYLFLSDMGVSLVLNMRSSMIPANTQELLSTSISLRIILSILAFPLLMAAGFLLDMSSERMILLGVIGLSVFFETFAEMFYSIFRASEKMVYESVCRILMGFTCLISVAVFIRFESDLTVISLAYVLRTFAAAAIAVVFLRKTGFSIKPQFRADRLKELFIAALPLGIMSIHTVIHQRVDTVLIRQMLGENAVAAWHECLKIIEIMILAVIPTLLPGALFPSLCRSFRDGVYQRQTGSMARVFMAFAVVLSVSVLSAGNRVLRVIWGSEYLRSIDPGDLQLCLFLSLAGLAGIYLVTLMISSLLALNKVRIVIPVTAGGLVLVVAGNYLLIPVIGLPAVAVLFALGNALMTLCYWVFLKWKGFYLPVWKEAGISILAALPAFAVIPFVRNLPFIPAILIPPVIYAPIWWFTGGNRTVREVFPHRI